MLSLAASIERGSEHPLAQAIIRGVTAMSSHTATVEKQEDQLQQQISIVGVGAGFTEGLQEFEAVSGMGVKATINNKSMLFGNRKLMLKFELKIEEEYEQQMFRLESEGKTVMILAVERVIAGLVAVADTLKESSSAAIKALRDLAIRTVMLTGDNEKTAKAVASKVGIEKVIANVLPGEKAAVIKQLQSEGHI